MVAARTGSFKSEVALAFSRESSSTLPESPTPGTGTSGKISSAVSSTHAVQRPLGASEKIFAPHLRQILITLIICPRLGVRPHFVLRRILSGLMRELQQSDNATRFRYHPESQQFGQFP